MENGKLVLVKAHGFVRIRSVVSNLHLLKTQPNRVNWKMVHGQKNLKMCSICEHIAERGRLQGMQVGGFQPIYKYCKQFTT